MSPKSFWFWTSIFPHTLFPFSVNLVLGFVFLKRKLMCTIKKHNIKLFCHYDKCLWKVQRDSWEGIISLKFHHLWMATFSSWESQFKKHSLFHLGWSSIRWESLNPSLNSSCYCERMMFHKSEVRVAMLIFFFFTVNFQCFYFTVGRHDWSCCSLQ